MRNKLHIVSFDIPYPANYGGVIDAFYRLKALHEAGVEVTLHCFEYGERKPQPELEKFATSVIYYPRRKLSWRIWLPYIVATRNHPRLLENLLADDAPILFEAIHSCYFLDHPTLVNRKKFVRMHNIEHDYYSLLAGSEKKIWKKLYFQLEALLLKSFESKLKSATSILAIAENDRLNLELKFGSKVQLLPPAHANVAVVAKPGRGVYCFYHGKLSVAENQQAALFLVEKVFSRMQVPFVIAGDEISIDLANAAKGLNHITLLIGLSPEEIDHQIQEAHINVLPTFQPTGIKLKLVNVLYKGRFIIVNSPMVKGSGFEAATLICDDEESMAQQIRILMNTEFSEADRLNRIRLLGNSLDVKYHIEKLIRQWYPTH